MLPFPHIVLFVPLFVLAASFVTAVALNFIIDYATRSRLAQLEAARQQAAIQAATPRHSAEIIYFTPRKTSVASLFSAGMPQQAMHR